MLREVVVKYLREKKEKKKTPKNKLILTSMLAEVSPSELLPEGNVL